MAPIYNLAERPYAIQVINRGSQLLPYTWTILDARTRTVVQTTPTGFRNMEEAFKAAQPALHKWLYPPTNARSAER